MPEVSLNGAQKAATLLVALGPEGAADIYRCLNEEEIERLTVEIAHLSKIEPEVRRQVIMEFRDKLMAQEITTQGGTSYAKEVLKQLYGAERAEETINRLLAHFEERPFESIKRVLPEQILEIIKNESPQTIALVLSYMPPIKRAEILSRMEADLQKNVAKRMAMMSRINPEVIRNVDRVLRERIPKVVGEEIGPVGGVLSLVETLQMSDKATEKVIIDALADDDPDLADEIKKKMFIFEDILLIDDRGMQLVLREVDTADLALALKGAEERIKDKVFKNLPKRAADMLKDEISFLGPKKAQEVGEAQQKVIDVVRKMEESGDVIISRGGRKGEAIIE